MSSDTPKSNQEITAGDGSYNYQAGGDLHVHHAAGPEIWKSAIVTPTNTQVARYDLKLQALLRTLENISGGSRTVRKNNSAASIMGPVIVALIFAFGIYENHDRLTGWLGAIRDYLAHVIQWMWSIVATR